MSARTDSRAIGQQQQRHGREEFITCVRALLMTPLMNPVHDNFAGVRRRADALRDWFARETGWALHIARDGARLFKRPATLSDATRGLPKYDRRRYTLLCLACAVLERAEPQITLQVLGQRLLSLAAEPELVTSGFSFTLGAQHERGELVAVCRTLLELGVLVRVAGDEEGYVRAGADAADALYDVGRRALSGMLAAVRGPSTWLPEEAPTRIEARLHALVDEHVADSEEARRTALRHHLSRRLLDDPVIYIESLDDETRAYFMNQRGVLAARLSDNAGLGIEQRAEGLALVDESGELTDVAMPAEGTDAHATLLVADFLATADRNARTAPGSAGTSLAGQPIHEDAVRTFVAAAKDEYGRYWRKSAREPGGEDELAEIALDRLAKLALIARDGRAIRPLPALARFALGAPQAEAGRPRKFVQSDLLFGETSAT
jgi:uncharacterized protein (TIGR02678 family)